MVIFNSYVKLPEGIDRVWSSTTMSLVGSFFQFITLALRNKHRSCTTWVEPPESMETTCSSAQLGPWSPIFPIPGAISGELWYLGPRAVAVNFNDPHGERLQQRSMSSLLAQIFYGLEMPGMRVMIRDVSENGRGSHCQLGYFCKCKSSISLLLFYHLLPEKKKSPGKPWACHLSYLGASIGDSMDRGEMVYIYI